MNRLKPIALACLMLAAPFAHAQPWRGEDPAAISDAVNTRYTIDLARSRSQLMDLTIEMADVDADTTLLQLPVWRIGRYEVIDPAGTVRTLSAHDAAGREIAFTKLDKSTWSFDTSDADSLIVEYTIYANSINNRTRHADASHAFISPSMVLMYDPKRRSLPVSVEVTGTPDDWRVATGLDSDPAGKAGRAFVARDYDTLADCPLEIGIHDLKRFEVRGVPHEIVIWGTHQADLDQLAEDFAKIVDAQAQVFEFTGPLPYGRYVFMIHSGDGLGGGTEHINSTIMQTNPKSFTDDDRYGGFLGLVSHEMFHTWNVKRLRPAGIAPYDYQHENYTDLLWVAEGTTSYYDDLILARTGLIDLDEYIDRIRGGMQYVRTQPGLHVQTLEESSFDAWIKFNHRTADSPNYAVNFYSQGALASLLIDFWVRDHTADERSLDNVMRDLYQRHPLEDGGFTTGDLAQSMARTAEQPLDAAREFLHELVGQTGDMELEEALLTAGLELTLETDREGSDLGLRLGEQDAFAKARTVYEGRPAFAAGVIADDLIIAIDDSQATPDSVKELLKRTDPGTAVTLTIVRRSKLIRITLTTAELAPKWELERVEEPTRAQRSRFQSWTGQPFESDDESDD